MDSGGYVIKNNRGYKSDARFEIIEFWQFMGMFQWLMKEDEFYTVSIEECISDVPNLSSNFNQEN